ncbi:DUF5715 family protein [Parabacteroides sp. OttesenSCG-928-J18]|nr:DUF5715 family protein [Parabacteroides sp. OttesenSCG-928-J18]
MKIKPFVWLILCLSWMTLTSSCGEKRGELRRIWYKGSYNRDFNDLNPLHLEAAQRLGIRPVSSREEAKKASRKMIEIKTNKYYEVEELTHSIPYLVPEAAGLLETIGKNFIDSLQSHNAPHYKVKVTSVTRTVDDIEKLQKGNINSSSNSAHLYGTTFDISWVRYTKINKKDALNIEQEDLKMVLAMVLRDLQKQGKCYVKHERKQGCFHITAR